MTKYSKSDYFSR